MMARARGFTLIELLVVLVIIGCLVSVAVLANGSASSGRELRDEAERLAATIAILADEAVLDGREYGLLVTAESYRVLAYDNASGTWADDATRPERRPAAWMRLSLELEGEALKLPEPKAREESRPGLAKDVPEQDTRKEKPVPQVLILSSGELTPFSLRLEERRADGNAYALASDGYQLPSAEQAKER
ncbi:type II secretion system minor pseudopilin GspH [Pseudomonas tohonis]|uniref:type II secretion system minor pseudopilin GspH n=1 Tax=Pseudomonas tohonis TaxID=2725477 RepID=UPI0029537B99|nr:type II secretion system minor pseudopilin GspH [Pseudomonas tohonis]